MSLTLTSPAFKPFAEIPARYTCEGDNLSPPLEWRDVPRETKSLALIVEDPDAPRATFAHWLLYDLPPSSRGLPEGATLGDLPRGVRAGVNDFRHRTYDGPCPPSGRHRYFLKLFALDTVLHDLGPANRLDLERAIQGHTIAQAELVGTYQKKQR